MTTSADENTPGRDRTRSRPGVAARLAATATVVSVLLGAAVYAAVADPPSGDRSRDDLVAGWSDRPSGLQVLGGERVAGRPLVQRMVHDGVQFTVSVAPARPGPNLVRVDTLVPGSAGHHGVERRAGASAVQVGTPEAPPVRARPRPGADGLWAVVDLPERSGMVLVSHGPEHRLPFVVTTGEAAAGDASGARRWTGPDGPECLAQATGALISGSAPVAVCPSERLGVADRAALVAVVRTLARRGVEELAVLADASSRSTQARAAVGREAAAHRVQVVDPRAAPGQRGALLVVSGWSTAARDLAAVSSLPLRKQPMRSDGTWLAPWLLSPGVVDSTSGAVIPLGFDIREGAARTFSQTLRTYLPGQAPTASGFAGWRGEDPRSGELLRLYAASRAAYMPAGGGAHAGHETTVSWFPGGTITPVGNPFRVS